ncbi:hypothetical protein ZEAMMB73_Zm00001d004320 [Zea mays]|jgi:hypothetical protein|uniref:Uncharacterized protein n=1 Tax=Zea mays TaxID=4577 RepID=A0A1D6EET3_MAIZE|nr:hypothetical protein ZEAMMB73_Zm00001d004320 [Zea mays]
MKGIVPQFLCILLIATTSSSSTALARKLAENQRGLQAGQVQAEPAINVDGRPSTGYGDHVCPRNMFPNCNRLDQASSNNNLG